MYSYFIFLSNLAKKNCAESCLKLIPMDTHIKKKWLEMLIAIESEKSEDVNFFIKFSHAIIKSHPTEFGVDELKRFCASEIIELFDEAFDEMKENSPKKKAHKMVEFAVNVHKKSMITKTGIINIWHAISEHLLDNDKWFVAQFLVTIIKETCGSVETVDGGLMMTKVQLIKEALLPNLKFGKLKKIQKDMKQVVKYLEGLTENPLASEQQPSTSKHSILKAKELKKLSKAERASSEPERINESFKLFVEMLRSDKFLTMTFDLNDPKRDAEFFFESAIHNEMTAMKFALAVTSIDSEEFNKELFELCETRFRNHHNTLTCGNYSENEILATATFIGELYIGKMMPRKNIETLINFIAIQPRFVVLSGYCATILNQVLSMAEVFRLPLSFGETSTQEKEENM